MSLVEFVIDDDSEPQLLNSVKIGSVIAKILLFFFGFFDGHYLHMNFRGYMRFMRYVTLYICGFCSSPLLMRFCLSSPFLRYVCLPPPPVHAFLGHWDTRTQGHQDTGTPGHRDTGTPGHWDLPGTPVSISVIAKFVQHCVQGSV